MDEPHPSPPPLKAAAYRPSLWFWISAGTVFFSYVFWLILIFSFVPNFAGIYRDFGAELPKLSQMLFDYSAYVEANFMAVQIPILGISGLTLWLLYALDKRQQIFAVLVIGNIPAAIVILIMLPVLFPFFQIFRQLGGG